MTILLDQLNDIHRTAFGHVRVEVPSEQFKADTVYEVSGKVNAWQTDEILGTQAWLPLNLKLQPLYYSSVLPNVYSISDLTNIRTGRKFGYQLIAMHLDAKIAAAISVTCEAFRQMPTYDYTTYRTPIATTNAGMELGQMLKDQNAYILGTTTKVYK